MIAMHEDRDADGDVDGSDAKWRLVYDERWRVVAAHSGTEAGPREIYVHHNAGFGGFGGSSYIDQLILRDRDPDGGNPLVLSERVYHCQNMRHDVVALIDANGEQVEQARYSAYGVPFCLPAADCDSDVDVFDFIQLGDWINASVYDVRGDVNLDGVLNVFDFTALGNRNGSLGGRGKLSIANGAKPTNSRFGYAGYLWHQNVAKNHVRNRVYDPAMGRWITRDPIRYAALQSNLYEYVAAMTLVSLDPFGLQRWWIEDWIDDSIEGLEGVRDAWDDIFADPDPVDAWTHSFGDQDIDQVQDALATCECIPGGEQIVAPINIGLDLIQGDCRGATQGALCSVIPGPGGRSPVPRSTLPRAPGTGFPLPTIPGVPHTQIGVRQGRNGPYRQAREWGTDTSCPKRDIDFTDHGRPDTHVNPHQHPWHNTPSGPQRDPRSTPFDPTNASVY